MDRKLEDELKAMSRRLETTLEIIMEHFRETEDRIEEIVDRVEMLEKDSHPPVAPGGTSEIMNEIQELRDALAKIS